MTWRPWACLALCCVSGASFAEEDPAPARLLKRRVSVESGVAGLGYQFSGGRFGDAFFGIGAAATLPLWRGLLTDVELFTLTPTRPEGAGFTGLLSWRLGWTGERWAVLAGALAEWTPGAQPAVQLWPTLHARYQFRTVGLSTGLFEDHGLALSHLTVESEYVSIGYVPPLGVRAAVRIPAWRDVGVETRVLAYRLANTEVAFLTIGAVWGLDPEASR